MVRGSTSHIMVQPGTQTKSDPNCDKTLATSNHPRTSKTYQQRQDYVDGYELQFKLFFKYPLHTNSVCGKREAHINWSMVMQRQHLLLEPPWGLLASCRRTLSAVNATGTRLRDSINSGLTRWRMAVSIHKRASPRKSGRIP